MNLKELQASIKDHSKDIKINLSSIMNVEGSPSLTLKQIYGIALACAYTTHNSQLVEVLLQESSKILSEKDIEAIKSAATIMAMNNIYYRFCHMLDDQKFSSLPAGLRMNVIAKHGVDKVDFELYSLAASIINGCGLCVQSHSKQLIHAGLSKIAIQSCAKISAVVNALTTVAFIN
jgi:alkyl hydroperoxide reductase subunit D